MVGLVITGVWLGWSPRDIYPHPDELCQSEIRRPSLLENPLGFPPGSQGLSTLIVTYRDAKGNTLVQQDYEFTDGTAAQRLLRRTILWGAKGTQRAVVELDNGHCLFFPEPRETSDDCPPDNVVQAYLNGEPIDGIRGTASQ